jgi:hypothetical protein
MSIEESSYQQTIQEIQSLDPAAERPRIIEKPSHESIENAYTSCTASGRIEIAESLASWAVKSMAIQAQAYDRSKGREPTTRYLTELGSMSSTLGYFANFPSISVKDVYIESEEDNVKTVKKEQNLLIKIDNSEDPEKNTVISIQSKYIHLDKNGELVIKPPAIYMILTQADLIDVPQEKTLFGNNMLKRLRKDFTEGKVGIEEYNTRFIKAHPKHKTIGELVNNRDYTLLETYVAYYDQRERVANTIVPSRTTRNQTPQVEQPAPNNVLPVPEAAAIQENLKTKVPETVKFVSAEIKQMTDNHMSREQIIKILTERNIIGIFISKEQAEALIQSMLNENAI